MKVKRIVVDELPKNCASCFYCGTDYSERPVCFALEKEKDIGYVVLGDRYPETRPSWCPLQVEDECMWKIETSLKGSRFEWRVYKSPHEGVVESMGGRFTFCPVCGKRIRYEEE